MYVYHCTAPDYRVPNIQRCVCLSWGTHSMLRSGCVQKVSVCCVTAARNLYHQILAILTNDDSDLNMWPYVITPTSKLILATVVVQ